MLRPVEISLWTLPRLLLMDLSVCSATIALLLVRMLDMSMFLCSFTLYAWRARAVSRPDETVFLTNAIAAFQTMRHPTSDARPTCPCNA
jgi:hypothetical protein